MDRCRGILVAGRVAGAVVVGMAIACVGIGLLYIVGVAFIGQYLATLSALRPGNERKLPALTARRNVDLTGDPTVQCRYSMRFFVDGRSYTW